MSLIHAFVVTLGCGFAPALAQSQLHVFHGDAATVRLGRVVDGGRDVDGDGHPDIVLGAYTDGPTAPEQGSVRVMSGWSGVELHRFVGAGRDWLGVEVRLVGDIDGDGLADVAAGATQANLGGSPPGYARTWSGSTGASLWTRNGPSAYSDYGCSIASLGDLDGDGRNDLAVGARYASPAGTRSGLVELLSGATGASISVLAGSGPQAWFGWSIAAAGDVDSDGVDDLAIGIPGWDEPGSNDCGAIELRSMPSGALIRRIVGAAPNESFGESVAGGVDLDGDGLPEVIGGSTQAAYQGAPISGVVRVHSAATGALLRELGVPTTFANCGRSCAIIGDVDGDGASDIAVGCPGQPASSACGGRAFVFSFASGTVLRSACGDDPDDALGTSVASAGDVNADGYSDWITGAPASDVPSLQSGSALVLSGWACAAPSTYCIGLPNSVGAGARIGWSGSASISWNRLRLTCSGLPPSSGRFFLGTSQTQVLFGDGYRCVAGPTSRLPVLAIGATGAVDQAFDVSSVSGSGVLVPGSVRNFQFWYRNQMPGGTGFNLSDALNVVFCP